MSQADIPGAAALQRACFPPPFPEELLWTEEHLQRHLEVFPDGQWVTVTEGQPRKVVGSASSLIISEENWQSHQDWETTTGGHFFERHDPEGTTLFGADISVHPEFRYQGIGRSLYEARFEVVIAHGLARYGTACRLPGYAAWASHEGGSPEQYARGVAQGELSDRTLTPLLRYGLRLTGVIENHMEDKESGNAAAILEWTP